MTEYERLHKACDAAKQAYDDAERALASARFTLNYAERARKREWDKLVAAAETPKSAPVYEATHNSGEGDPSVMPDYAGADTHSLVSSQDRGGA